MIGKTYLTILPIYYSEVTMSCSECVICYEAIGATNVVTTECGHIFHCSCLMKNASVNGFGCPMCRTKIVSTSDIEDSDSDDEEYEDSERSYDIRDDPDEQEGYSLRGMRWMFNRIESEARNPPTFNGLSMINGLIQEETFRLDGMIRNARRNLNSDLQQEVIDLTQDEEEDEDEDEDELESEESWNHSKQREEKLNSMTDEMLKKYTSRISYNDLWKAYLAISDPEIYYGGIYEKIDTKIMNTLRNDLNQINQTILEFDEN